MKLKLKGVLKIKEPNVDIWRSVQVWADIGPYGHEKTWYYKYQGRWITPYERHMRNWPSPTLNDLLRLEYSGVPMHLLVKEDNPLLKFMSSQNDAWTGKAFPLPIKVR